MIRTTDRIRLDVNMRENPADITWQPSGSNVTIKLLNTDVDLTLDLGPESIRQLKQALSWTPTPRINFNDRPNWFSI